MLSYFLLCPCILTHIAPFLLPHTLTVTRAHTHTGPCYVLEQYTAAHRMHPVLTMSSPFSNLPAAAVFPETCATSPGALPSAALSSPASTCTYLLAPPRERQTNNISASNDTHAGHMAREQQQMIEQLMSTGLVQAADLLGFGFSAAELCAAGVHLPSPHHRSGEQTRDCRETEQPKWAGDAYSEDRRHRGVPRKRAWCNDAAQTRPQKSERAAQSSAVRGDATTAVPTPEMTREPQTVVKSVTAPALLSEEMRTRSLRAATLVEQTQRLRQQQGSQDCARLLCYDDTGDEEVSNTTSKGRFPGEATEALAPMAQATETYHRTRCNTALAFSGLDVAVVKEIAQRLQDESVHDTDTKSSRTREYLESRELGNTPYM
ncbi:hypothetical protein, conserved [Leishmania tarentolae]|uniref:Uncharacterized protein n=1 Tax=Leishmania tarentolae TaxID=5689 RepID=A0A640K9X7_LEITA|nr:hypothetical protein, conserved [Leishmania tarentolae]